METSPTVHNIQYLELENVTTAVTTASIVEYLWTFDSTYRDLSSTFNGIPVNGATFNSSTITGYGSSLQLSLAANQSLMICSPFLNLNNRSWTFETWIYPFTLSNSSEHAIIGQCQSLYGSHMCLHLNIRYGKLYLGFFNDDLPGITWLKSSTWYHVAFVFDHHNFTQSIYLDGLLDNTRIANGVYLGSSGILTFGSSTLGPWTYHFDGLIDQLYYTNRVKTSAEILDDATLTLYFSFDNGSVYDHGPLGINGSLFGLINNVTGRIGEALQFGPSTGSYFRVYALILLGTSARPYSMSIWIKPTTITMSTIIHVSERSNGLGWCIGMLTLSSSQKLVAISYGSAGPVSITGPILPSNSWTHAVITYSNLNGFRLYVNGTLFNSTIPFVYSASNRSNYLFLGSSVNGTLCSGTEGQFIGALDEFRLYSRELTASDVFVLSHS